MNQSKRLTVAIVLVLLAVGASLSFAQTPKPKAASDALAPKAAAKSEATATPASASTTHDLSSADLETFFDGFLPQQIIKGDIAGVVITVVKDGKPIFEKGYGYSDVETKKPVSPQGTLFRPGSISKTFTWTAIMQLVEQGKLDLDADVNQYLDFKLPAEFGKPTTLRDIMTHRGGFEETVRDLFFGAEKELIPMSQYLPTHIPHQIYPPGTISAYSNYATTVAGYIVQRVSGENFDDYIDNHIFKPLGMKQATFRQPLPENLKPFMSSGYVRGSDKAKGFEYVEVAPAGSASISGDAMTHWMIAHLQNGKYGDAQILKPETAIAMHARQKGWPDGINAMCLGFYEQNTNGHRVIGHGGDTEQFHSDMLLLVNDNVGIFVSYNSAGAPGKGDPRGMLFDTFMDRYFPAPAAPEPATVSTAAQDAASVAGPYVSSRRFETNLLAITSLLGQAKIQVDPKDNTIFIEELKGENGKPTHFREIGPMTFQAVGGKAKIIFSENNGQRIANIDYPFMPFMPVASALNNQKFNYFIICFAIAVIVLNILFWPVAWAIRKHYAKPLVLDDSARKWRRYVRIVCIVDILYLIGMISIATGSGLVGGLNSDKGTKIHLVQIIGLLGGLGFIIAVIAALKSWGDQTQWFWYKIWNTLLAAGCFLFLFFIWHWHLLNFDLNY